MLTSDLLRARVEGRTLRPSWIDPDKPGLRRAAEELLALLDEALDARWTRGAVEEALGELVGVRRDHKVLKGLAKVMLDRATFQVESPLPPVALRERVFRAARAHGPLALEPGPLGRPTAETVLAEVALELDSTPEAVADALYADLPSEERLVELRRLGPEALLHRYNVALVQALLLRATDLTLRLHDASAPRLRQLFRRIKFHQLMHLCRRDGDVLEVVVDGPASLFRQSTRYGLELATFFPAILLQECPWTLTATVLWTKRRHAKTLTLTHEDGLVSHYRDQGAYKTREQALFEERWNASERAWDLTEGREPIELGGQAVLVPDYTLTHPDGRVAHLDVVGFWRRESLERRLALLDRYGPGNVVVAVSRRRRGSRAKELPDYEGPLIPFAEIVTPKKVLDAVEAVGRPPQ